MSKRCKLILNGDNDLETYADTLTCSFRHRAEMELYDTMVIYAVLCVCLLVVGVLALGFSPVLLVSALLLLIIGIISSRLLRDHYFLKVRAIELEAASDNKARKEVIVYLSLRYLINKYKDISVSLDDNRFVVYTGKLDKWYFKEIPVVEGMTGSILEYTGRNFKYILKP